MADEVAADGAATEPTRLYNSSTQPRVVSWGDGVVMPGESFLTDSPEGYAPNQPNSPWTTDPEATDALSALLSRQEARAGDASEVVADGHTEAQGSPQGLQDAPQGQKLNTLRTLPNGDVVNEAGAVIGHEDVPNPAQADKPAPVADQSGGTA